ncbi:MAG: hypothetical protein ABH952_09150 [Candidatus Omnitrophota bacterium]
MRFVKNSVLLIVITLILFFNLQPGFAVDMPADDTANFTLTVTNIGPATISSVSGTSSIDSGFSIEPASFSINSILPKSSKTFTFTVTSPSGADEEVMYGKATFNITSAKDVNGKESKFIANTGEAVVSAGDNIPPTITISGVTDGATYTHAVMAHYVVSDKNLDPATVKPDWDGISGNNV